MNKPIITILAILCSTVSVSAQELPDSTEVALPPSSGSFGSYGLSSPDSPFAMPLRSVEFDNAPFAALPIGSLPPSERPLFPIDPFAAYVPRSNGYSFGDYTLLPIRNYYLRSDDFGLRQTYRLADGLVLLSDAFVSTGRFSPHHGRYVNANINAQLRYNVAEGLNVNVFGQYSTSPFLTSSAFSTSIYGTNYGISADYRVTDFLSIEAGVTRVYFMGDWQTEAFVTPVLHIGDMSIPIPVINIDLGGSSSDRFTAPAGTGTSPANNSSKPRLPYDR